VFSFKAVSRNKVMSLKILGFVALGLLAMAVMIRYRSDLLPFAVLALIVYVGFYGCNKMAAMKKANLGVKDLVSRMQNDRERLNGTTPF
jgi:branched-subunit amino acid transport protein AzlD